MVKFGILGPIELSDGERRRPVGGPRQLALLAFLLLHANRAVSADQLIDALWGDQDPRGAVKRLQVAIARLRKTLDIDGASGQAPLRTAAGGYLLAVGPGDLDADVFQSRVQDGRRALEEGEPARAAEVLRGALGLWRGPPLAEVAYESFAQAEIRRLEELRLGALEARVEADLRLGRHTELTGDLQALVAGHPARERLTGQLMLALYRCGRQADALDVYQRTRAHLATELGLEPGPALKALQARILEQAPSLELPPGDTGAALEARRGAPGPDRPPARPVRLLGREADAQAVMDLLLRPDVRLLTLTGIGGVGKTSLAIEVAHRLAGKFADGVAFVDLVPLSDPDRAAGFVLHALGCTPEPGGTATETLCRLAATREQLLVLDNLEHVLAAAPLLADLLNAAPRLRLLVTSRAALELRAEHRYPLDPLALPETREPAAVAAAPATALFIALATALDPAFRLTADGAAAIASVCARVDGLPLAIELAAARTSALSPQQIARRLDPILPALGPGARDAPQRQRTLRATLDWSYELLDERERAAFAQLAVFAGGCTTEAAEQVTGADLDTIEGLIAKSMVTRRRAGHGERRLGMLQPLREYAAERLRARADEQEVGERHSRYYSALAETARTGLRGPGQRAWAERLDADADNLRSAMARDQQAGNLERVLRLATALEFWWSDRLLWSEGRGWIEEALATARDHLRPRVRAEALHISAWLSARLVDFEHAADRSREALGLYRQLEDPAGISRCLAVLAVAQLMLGDRDNAQIAAAEAVRIGCRADPWTLAVALAAEANTEPDLAAAERLTEEAARLFEQVHDARSLAWLWRNLGSAALHENAIDTADRCFQEALEHTKQLDDPIQSILTLRNHAFVAVERQQDAAAAASFGEMLAGCRAYGLRRPVCRALVGLAAIAARAGEADRAARLLGASFAVRFGQPLARVEQRLLTADVEPVRQLYGDDAWENAHAAGRELSLEDAIALGIETASRYAGEPAPEPPDRVSIRGIQPNATKGL